MVQDLVEDVGLGPDVCKKGLHGGRGRAFVGIRFPTMAGAGEETLMDVSLDSDSQAHFSGQRMR